MKQVLLTAIAAGALAMASTGYAQNDEKMFLSNMNGKKMVMGGTSAEGTELLMGENGAKPGTCPAGSFYTTTDPSQQMVMACDNDARFALSAPESGAMMANGEAYPEGSMIMTPQ